jgi:hypothetical protein
MLAHYRPKNCRVSQLDNGQNIEVAHVDSGMVVVHFPFSTSVSNMVPTLFRHLTSHLIYCTFICKCFDTWLLFWASIPKFWNSEMEIVENKGFYCNKFAPPGLHYKITCAVFIRRSQPSATRPFWLNLLRTWITLSLFWWNLDIVRDNSPTFQTTLRGPSDCWVFSNNIEISSKW